MMSPYVEGRENGRGSKYQPCGRPLILESHGRWCSCSPPASLPPCPRPHPHPVPAALWSVADYPAGRLHEEKVCLCVFLPPWHHLLPSPHFLLHHPLLFLVHLCFLSYPALLHQHVSRFLSLPPLNLAPFPPLLPPPLCYLSDFACQHHVYL